MAMVIIVRCRRGRCDQEGAAQGQGVPQAQAAGHHQRPAGGDGAHCLAGQWRVVRRDREAGVLLWAWSGEGAATAALYVHANRFV